jgi:hypothetical protein
MDTCEQFTERTVFLLEQERDAGVSRVNPISFHVNDWELPAVPVLNGSDNSTGDMSSCYYLTLDCCGTILAVMLSHQSRTYNMAARERSIWE